MPQASNGAFSPDTGCFGKIGTTTNLVIKPGEYLLPPHRKTVQSTVPVLRAHGEKITTVFYRQMFEAHPELLNIFNPANQRNGAQARSLAASILAYAAHIDQLDHLGEMVEQIAQK